MKRSNKNGFFRAFPDLCLFIVGLLFICLLAASVFLGFAAVNQRIQKTAELTRITT